MQRVREDIQREQLRAEEERDRWHAVRHEIMSPLQSLMALHGDDDSTRYISVAVRADEYSLEDVVTHVLRNADRHRSENSLISMTLELDETSATFVIGNQGEPIVDDMLEKILNMACRPKSMPPQRAIVARVCLWRKPIWGKWVGPSWRAM